MGYTGIAVTDPESYILSDTIPYNPEFDIEELKIIQNKLENFTSSKSTNGISPQEAEIFLDWITFNARNYATRNSTESPLTASMKGQCAPTQNINFKILTKMGLDVRTFNTADCIGEIPITNEDIIKMQNGWDSSAVRHSVALVNIPIMFDNGITELCKFQLDPTFRQFCTKEDCNADRFYLDSKGRESIAPAPGYFMQKDNLLQLGVSPEIAQKSEDLCKCIISKGYFYLTEETAKLYGDAFFRSSIRLQFQNLPIQMSGKDYLRNFETTPMQVISANKADEDKYTILPSEMKEKKKGFLSNIFNYLKNMFHKPTLNQLPAAGESTTTTIPEEEGIKPLSDSEMEAFKRGETQILNAYNNQEKTEEKRSPTNIER